MIVGQGEENVVWLRTSRVTDIDPDFFFAVLAGQLEKVFVRVLRVAVRERAVVLAVVPAHSEQVLQGIPIFVASHCRINGSCHDSEVQGTFRSFHALAVPIGTTFKIATCACIKINTWARFGLRNVPWTSL